jgi:hypothetical protein
VHTEKYARAGHGASDQGLAVPTTEPVSEVPIDMSEALARCVASGIDQTLVRAPLTWSQRAQLQGVCDPIPSSVEISVYVEDQGGGGTLGFYLIALERTDEISHAEHATLASAVQAAEAQFGVPRTAWAAAE